MKKESKRDEAEARAGVHSRHELFEALFELAPQPILLADDSRRYVAANAAAVEFIGWPREKILGMSIEDLAAESIREQVPSLWAAFLAGETLEGEFELATAFGDRKVDFSARANYLPGLHMSILRPAKRRVPDDPLLTPRQREVLRLLALGYTGTDIAKELVISPETVRTHIDNAMQTLKARTRPEAIAVALMNGEIEL